MKRFLISLAFVCALAVPSFGQASDNTITGTIYDGFNNALVGFSFTVTVTRRDGIPVSTSPKTVTTIAAGALPSTFQLPRRSYTTFRGNFTIGRYNFTNGLSMFIPDESTTAIENLLSVEDAAAALVAVASAPSDAQYVVGTVNSTLSAEQSLGALTTGLLKNTVSGSTGTLSTAVAADLPLISTLTADATPDSAADYVLTYDASAGVHKKVLLSNLPSSGGGGTWGSITGTLSSQTDLQSALDLKANLISPSFTTPTLGVASATSINKLAITTPATGSTLAIADGKTFTASNTITLTATDGSTLAIGAGGTLGSAAYTASSAYEVPLTFSTGLTRSTNTITVNTSQNIATLSNLTSNGIVTTSGGGGTLGVTVPGTGVLTALGVNVGSAGAPVLFDGAGGTPSSLTLTSATGLPPTTGIVGWPANASGVLTNNGSGTLSWAAAGGGSPGGSNTQLQYNNSSAFGGISGATSDGTNLTTSSGALRATSPRITTSIFDTNGLAIISLNPTASAVNSLQITNGATGSPGIVDLAAIGSDSNIRLSFTSKGTSGAVFTNASGNGLVVGPNGVTNPVLKVVTNVSSQASGVSITGNADGTAPEILSLSRTQQTASVAGNGLNITADPAIAGSSSAGAAAGGSVTITAGNAARLTSGNAVGGSIYLVPGTGIGGGASGQVLLPSSTSATVPPLAIVGGTTTGISGANGQLYGVVSGAYNWGALANKFTVPSGSSIGFSSSTSSTAPSTQDTAAVRHAAAVWRFTNGSTGAGSLVLGTSTVGSIGTSGVGVLAIANGTAPSSSPADEFQLYSADWNGAGTAAAHLRNEEGTIYKFGSTFQSPATTIADTVFASLPAATNGTILYCSDCAPTTPFVDSTCVGSGTGSLAIRLNGAWKCTN